MTERKRQTSEENDVTQRVVAKTLKGKETKIGQYNSGMFYIYFSDGGQIPRSMSGRFMRYEDAEHSVNTYQANIRKAHGKSKGS